jgi:acyl carrier protein
MSTADVPTVIERVRQYVVENYLYMRPDVQLLDDDPLLTRGIIDSMGVMEIIALLEDDFGITVGDTEITEENLGSLSAIGRYVASKNAAADAVRRSA